jgi:DNA-directed RNA polymerase beta' subunit
MPLEVKFQYPKHPDYYYEAVLERINLDDERENDLRKGKGFIVSEPQNIKKDVKDPNGIFSHRYGQLLQDVNPFADRYKCECGTLRSRIHNGIICHVCHTPVKYVDDDYNYFGYIVLKDPYYIIHPNLYKSIDYLVSRKKANLLNILEHLEEKDKNGFTIETGKINKDEPYKGIGMMEFKERFDEIMEYYSQVNPNKIEYYKDIMANKDKVFIQTIPVYTTHLRPFKVDGQYFSFEGTNAIYNLLAKLAYSVNKDHLMMFRKPKSKNKLLYDMQVKYNELYKELEDILAQKKGAIRSLFGGRYNFSSRSVIIPNPKLRIDEVTLPYNGLVELLQQTIINVLHKSYNMTYSEAYKMWYKAQIKRNDRIYQIIKGIIHDHERGIPILINS